MPVEFTHLSGSLVSGRFKGVLSVDEWLEAQRKVEDRIRRVGALCMLVDVKAFDGWERSERWGDLSFLEAHDQDVTAIAFVGSLRWQEDMLAFSLAGMRKAPVRYFEREQEALTWLAETAANCRLADPSTP